MEQGEEDLLRDVTRMLEHEPRLIQLPPHGRAILVGDTHGDLEATEGVISRFMEGSNILVFMGDYVDRGAFSRENVHCLLRNKRQHPDRLILLAGNHEGYLTKPFSPASFWEGLSSREKEIYGAFFSRLPLSATSSNGILAVHGGLPELGHLGEVNGIRWGDDQWDRIVWGDFLDWEGEFLGDWGGRPQFGRRYFERMMEKYQKKVLIRSHQPNASRYLFGKRCATIFTSYSYGPERQVAVVDLEKQVLTTDDITLKGV